MLILQSCIKNSDQNNEANSNNERTDLTPTLVKTARVEEKNFEYQIETSGKIVPLKRQVFFAENNGLLKSFNGVNSQSVRKGDVIAQLDKNTLALELEQAKLNEYNASIEYKSALLGFSKGDEVKVSDSVKKKLEVSSGYSAARLDLMKAEQALSKATIYAPFSGMIADVQVQSGSRIKSGDELFTIYSSDALVGEVQILESDFHRIKLGQPATVFPIAGITDGHDAKVVEINPIVDEYGLVKVKLMLAKPNGLLPGMNIRAVIKLPQHKALVVPKTALVIRSNKPVVFTMENGLAKWNYVTPGLENKQEIEIKEGISAGQTAIVSNNLQLAHDAPVKEEN